MLQMIGKMTLMTALYVLITMLFWRYSRGRKLDWKLRLLIGVLFGFCSILSTHFGVNYHHMMLNVRDMGPLSAGLFFDPFSGILAGLIGGIERYIAGTYWGVGSYTRIACSVSTCLAGFVAAILHRFILKGKKPSALYAFFIGAVMEVFHMYVVFITHRDDMDMAFYVVKTCSPAMIFFTGLGMACSSIVLRLCSGGWHNPLRKQRAEEVPVSRRFQIWLFAVMAFVLTANLLFSIGVQTQSAKQSARDILSAASSDIVSYYNLSQLGQDPPSFHVGQDGFYELISEGGIILEGTHIGLHLNEKEWNPLREQTDGAFFQTALFGTESLCRKETLNNGLTLLALLPVTEVYKYRDSLTYETAFGDIMVFAVIYILISMLVQKIVVDSLQLINASLGRIARGNLDEVVSVRNSTEFASLSDDINQTVDVLKGYISAAEKRIEQELEFARTIQASALPKNFRFPRSEFELYATMHPAKEVGGDFYDFFFVDRNRLALVIADVSGKGIPAALFMMRAKTAIRDLAEGGQRPAEILFRANNTLCEGNDAEMFVTVWLGILDLSSGVMTCANAGHEYPVLRRAGADYALYKDRHGLVLAAMEQCRFREYELKLEPGDCLFVYTDGIPEAVDEHLEQYGTDRLVQTLNRVKDQPMQHILSAVRQDIRDFVGAADQFDDITMLGIAYRGPGGGPDA